AAPGGPSAERGLREVGAFARLRVLGQARRLFIVCEGPDALYLLDQHAADERVVYHRLRQSYAERSVPLQRLLFPERVEISEHAASVVEAHREAFEALGLEVGLVGPTTAAVRAVPAVLRRAPPARLLQDLLDEVEYTGERAFGDAIDTAIATMACHGAIRGGDTLSVKECEALLARLDEVPVFGGHCPHGRPVVTALPFAQLESKLGR
ncbi:MAG: DNA mismatch repair protein MutL, partial [Myxococcales bacterium]|nr:DNA mismatch repair protein MutL [Myxococcales bacterium]